MRDTVPISESFAPDNRPISSNNHGHSRERSIYEPLPRDSAHERQRYDDYRVKAPIRCNGSTSDPRNISRASASDVGGNGYSTQWNTMVNMIRDMNLTFNEFQRSYSEKLNTAIARYPEQSKDWQLWYAEGVVWETHFSGKKFPGKEPFKVSIVPNAQSAQSEPYVTIESYMEAKALKGGFRKAFFKALNAKRHEVNDRQPSAERHKKAFWVDNEIWSRFWPNESFPLKDINCSDTSLIARSRRSQQRRQTPQPPSQPQSIQSQRTLRRDSPLPVQSNLPSQTQPNNLKQEVDNSINSPKQPARKLPAKLPTPKSARSSPAIQIKPTTSNPTTTKPTTSNPITTKPTTSNPTTTKPTTSNPTTTNPTTTKPTSSNPTTINPTVLGIFQNCAPACILQRLMEAQKSWHSKSSVNGRIIMVNKNPIICNENPKLPREIFQILLSEDDQRSWEVQTGIGCNIQCTRVSTGDVLLWTTPLGDGGSITEETGNLFLQGWIQRVLTHGIVTMSSHWKDLQSHSTHQFAIQEPSTEAEGENSREEYKTTFRASDLDMMVIEETAKVEGNLRLVQDEETGEVITLAELIKRSKQRCLQGFPIMNAKRKAERIEKPDNKRLCP